MGNTWGLVDFLNDEDAWIRQKDSQRCQSEEGIGKHPNTAMMRAIADVR